MRFLNKINLIKTELASKPLYPIVIQDKKGQMSSYDSFEFARPSIKTLKVDRLGFFYYSRLSFSGYRFLLPYFVHPMA